jgi:small subunit ribosomal protein S6
LKKYEAVFILEIRKIDDEGKAFTEEITKFLEGLGGKMESAVPMGRRQFAREIRKRKAGIYWNYVFSADAAKVGQLRLKYRLDERVLRMLIINYDVPAVLTRTEKSLSGE